MTTGGTDIYQAPSSIAEAEAEQLRLRALLELTDVPRIAPVTVTGLDVSYEAGSDRVVAAAVIVEVETLRVVESAVVRGEATFPYVPGLLAFREVPVLLEALGELTGRSEVLVCDGYGIAHPRRFGLACHLGVLTGLPSFGVAKNPFTTSFEPPGPERGDWSELRDGEEVLGRAVRTRAQVKPVFVSVGNRLGIEQATELTLALTNGFRIPEATRKADFLSRQALRGLGRN